MNEPLREQRIAVVTGEAQGTGKEIVRAGRAAVFRGSDPPTYMTGSVIEVGGGRYR
ncbi:hypothetical protein [Mycobacterium sp.]|uniref:hypothetical protein n=1 Tax=Mycobacterium sp. TaxID=1785 RepID=UPI003C716508